MKDSRIGAFGAIGLFLMLGLKWTTLVALPGRGSRAVRGGLTHVEPLVRHRAHRFSSLCARRRGREGEAISPAA